ncbi:MAG: glutaredoxin family protein [Giesbergeria sp.]|nr:glutaredoxin family protein [Giesbergeria sp.]MDD2609859.1 glutaredoxin family protein [Giesbergeria sp.]
MLPLWLAVGGTALAQASSQSVSPEVENVLRVYVRDGCPHCAHAKGYLSQLHPQYPGLRLEYRPVDTDPQAREELVQVSKASGHWPPGVPTFVYQGRVLVGFADAEHSGEALATLLQPPAPQTVPAPVGITDTEVALGSWGKVNMNDWGLPLFTLVVGLLDGFNPCAMWVLLFLLSLLVHLRNRRRMVLIAGTFVLVSGAVYYAFMAAWLNLFLAVGLSATVRVGLALLALGMAAFHLKDFVKGFEGPSLSIPASAKPGLYARMRGVMQAHSLPLALLAVASLAVVVNFIELLCTAGLPALYVAVLTQQSLPPVAHYSYLGLYILGYITDDALMVGSAVWALQSQKLNEARGRWLKLVSGLLMGSLGLVLLLRPHWL